jgi:preprotein translocase subunit SecA
MSLSTLHRRFRRLIGDPVRHDLDPYRQSLEDINRLEAELQSADDLALVDRARAVSRNSRSGSTLDDLLAESFALVREASRRTLGLRPFDEQIIAGIAMHQGKIAEMQTGEGKTLAAVAPVALNALGGHGVHVLTFNDYLARRDARWMGPIYRLLGLSVGCVQEGMGHFERQQAYSCDVTYLTAKEAGFDFLRNFLCLERKLVVRREAAFALVDEADSILIDEARIPLVIAGQADELESSAEQVVTLARTLRRGIDFDTDQFGHNIFLTGAGSRRVERVLGCGNLYDPRNLELVADLRNALHAEHLLRRDVDYIVRHGRVELVDDFTGRVADKRQWPDGLQAAIEAKERLTVQDEGRILGSITMQHFLQSYPRLCGMTATARPAAEELHRFYELGVVVLPTHRPCVRVDHDDVIFTHHEAKRDALVEEIVRVHATGRPILVGTASVAESEDVAEELQRLGLTCRVLNAANDEAEAEIVAGAGALGAVTISTNMAGRGTDIRLGGQDESDRDEVVALGGLYVIGTNRHESLRIDRQLRGRAGRQGDPGSSRFFISLQDPLIERYGVRNLITARYLPERQPDPVNSAVLRREIARAQRVVEGENYGIRRRLWEFSTPIEAQRYHLQSWRQDLLDDEDRSTFLAERSPERYAEVRAIVGQQELAALENRLTLLSIDRNWCDYLTEVRRIQDGIHVVQFVGKDPVAEFCRETSDAYSQLWKRIDDEVIRRFETIHIDGIGVDWQSDELAGPASTWTYLVDDSPFGKNPMRDLASRAGVAFLGSIVAGPLIFAWGLWMHVKRRRARAALRSRYEDGP